MSSIQSKFKSDAFPTVFDVAFKSVMPLSIAYLIYFALASMIMIPTFFYLFGIEMTELLSLAEVTDPFERQRVAEELFADAFTGLDYSHIGMLIAVCMVLFIIGAWYMNFSFITVEKYVRGRAMSFGELFKNSFNINILWIVLGFVALALVYAFLVMVFAAIMTAASVALGSILSAILGLVFGIGMAALLMQFVIMFAAIVHGNMSVGKAMVYSFKTIGFMRGLKYVFISFLVLISYLVLTLVLTVGLGMLMAIPILGMALYIVASVIMGGYMSGFFTAIQSGIYYRHSEIMESDSEFQIEDHLVL